MKSFVPTTSSQEDEPVLIMDLVLRRIVTYFASMIFASRIIFILSIPISYPLGHLYFLTIRSLLRCDTHLAMMELFYIKRCPAVRSMLQLCISPLHSLGISSSSEITSIRLLSSYILICLLYHFGSRVSSLSLSNMKSFLCNNKFSVMLCNGR